MTTVAREALCRSEFCPEPTNPDWHECVVCGNPVVEHAHIVARSQAPSRRKDKNNVVALCHQHHELQTLNKWAFHEKPLPFDGLVHQWLTDERGNTVWKRDIGASSDGSEPVSRPRVLASEPTPDASVSDGGEESAASGAAHAEGTSPYLADDAGRTSDGALDPTCDPVAMTPPSVAESLKPNGLELPDEFTFDDWTELAGMVAGMNKNRQWWAGDLILAGERFGERATQYWQELGYRFESLANCIRVCRRFPRPLRSELPFAHHAVVYALDDAGARGFLKAAAAQGWTVKQLREAVHGPKPKTVRFSLDELRERAESFWYAEAKNNGRRFLAAFLESLG